MKKRWKITSMLAVFCLLFSLFSPFAVLAENNNASLAQAQTTNSWDPDNGSYKISTVEDLKRFRNAVNGGNTFAETTVTLESSLEIPEGGDIGSIETGKSFDGTFNGQGYTISGFADSDSGLVNTLGKDGVITDTKMVVNLNITKTGTYGIFANSQGNSGIVTKCAAEGNVKIDVDAEGGSNSVAFYGIAPVYLSGRETDNIADCYSNLNIDAKVINVGQYGNNQLTIMGIAGCQSYKRQMGAIEREFKNGRMSNCYATGTINASLTTTAGNALQPNVFGVGDVKDANYVSGLYCDTTEGHLDKIQNAAAGTDTIKTPNVSVISDAQALVNASSYAGFDFDTVWTTKSDTVMPVLQSQSKSEDPMNISVDVLVKVPQKVVPDKSTATEGPVRLFAQLEITDKIGDDDLMVVGANGEDLTKYIQNCGLKGTITSTAVGSLKSKIYYTDRTQGERAGVKYENYRFGIDYDDSKTDRTFEFNSVKFVNKDDPTQTAALKGNGKDGTVTEAEVTGNILKSKQAIKILMDKFVVDNPAESFEQKKNQLISNCWYIMTMARCGYAAPEGYYDSFYKALSSYMASLEKNPWGDLISPDVTGGIFSIGDYFKVAGAVTAIGYDPRSVGGVDCIAPMYDYDKIKEDASTNNYTAKFYALIGLDLFGTSYNFDNEQASVTDMRNKLLTELAENANKNWTGDDETNGPDMAFMLFTALAPYYNTNQDAKEAGDKLFESAQRGQDCFGGYYALDVYNPASLAQVMIGSAATGMDIFREAAYIKNGYSLIDAANIFINFDKKTTFPVQGDAYADGNLGVANYQLPQGYESALRAIGESDYQNASDRFYDMSDVKISTIAVNDLISALPAVDSITNENIEAVEAQSNAVAEKWNVLSEAQKNSINTETWDAVKAKILSLRGMKGDVNQDQVVDVKDVTRINQYIVGARELSDTEFTLADVNNDGVVDAKDVTRIQQHIVGLRSEL